MEQKFKLGNRFKLEESLKGIFCAAALIASPVFLYKGLALHTEVIVQNSVDSVLCDKLGKYTSQACQSTTNLSDAFIGLGLLAGGLGFAGAGLYVLLLPPSKTASERANKKIVKPSLA